VATRPSIHGGGSRLSRGRGAQSRSASPAASRPLTARGRRLVTTTCSPPSRNWRSPRVSCGGPCSPAAIPRKPVVASAGPRRPSVTCFRILLRTRPRRNCRSDSPQPLRHPSQNPSRNLPRSRSPPSVHHAPPIERHDASEVRCARPGPSRNPSRNGTGRRGSSQAPFASSATATTTAPPGLSSPVTPAIRPSSATSRLLGPSAGTETATGGSSRPATSVHEPARSIKSQLRCRSRRARRGLRAWASKAVCR
jgi:hypothetical protein